MTYEDCIEAIALRGKVVSIGQIEPRALAKLNRDAKRGRLWRVMDFTYPHAKTAFIAPMAAQ